MAMRRETAEAMREAGRMCTYRAHLIDVMPWDSWPRSCDRCSRPQPVTLKFKLTRGVWAIDFLNSSSRLPIAPSMHVQNAAKIRDLVARTPTRWTLGERQAFGFGLMTGDGRCDIVLTMPQLVALRERQSVRGAA